MNSSVQRDRPLVFDLPHLSGLGGAVLPFRASTQRFDSPYRSSRHSERHNQMHSCVVPRNWANSLLNRRRARFFTAGRPSIRSLAVSLPLASLRMTLYSATSCPPVHAGNKVQVLACALGGPQSGKHRLHDAFFIRLTCPVQALRQQADRLVDGLDILGIGRAQK